jgi:hypothetical protein
MFGWGPKPSIEGQAAGVADFRPCAINLNERSGWAAATWRTGMASLAVLYSGTDPSSTPTYEEFGMPVLEAMHVVRASWPAAIQN